jgi:hypothetical protein
VITSLGYQEEFIKKKDIDVDAERKLGADWLAKREKQMKATKPKPSKKRNGGRK